MRELTIAARIENLDRALAFVDGELEKLACGVNTAMQIDIAVEEIFVNIARYAYASQGGDVTMEISVQEEPGEVTIRFRDSGIPYNPLAKPDPAILPSRFPPGSGRLAVSAFIW